MLFNSYEFIFCFLPISLFLFYLLQKIGNKEFLLFGFVSISLFFYAWWNPNNLWLITGSIFFNYWLSSIIFRTQNKIYLWLGILGNLSVLFIFKYINYVFHTINADSYLPFQLQNLTLPLAISFFTFQQISYLIDIWQKKVVPGKFSEFAFGVLFFPHLIAGPIIKYHDIFSQIENIIQRKNNIENYTIGFTIFIIGLFKKTCIADMLVPFSEKIFSFVENGYPIGFIDSWLGALAFTFQLYFDFSGYTDMAIGLAYMFGIHLPINFNSPYKAKSIIEFWRRWHISLSNFFRDYLYIPLGGNKKHKIQQAFNLLFVMSIVGLWHGAGNIFLLWGIYHGILLIMNHVFRSINSKKTLDSIVTEKISNYFHWFITFGLVVFGWVIFRAKDMNVIKSMLKGMTNFYGLNGGSLIYYDYRYYFLAFFILTTSAFFCLFFPNTTELMSNWKVCLNQNQIIQTNNKSLIGLKLKLNMSYAFLMAFITYFALTNLTKIQTKFIYFDF